MYQTLLEDLFSSVTQCPDDRGPCNRKWSEICDKWTGQIFHILHLSGLLKTPSDDENPGEKKLMEKFLNFVLTSTFKS